MGFSEDCKLIGANEEQVKNLGLYFWALAEKQKLKEERKKILEEIKKEKKEFLLSGNGTQKQIKWAKKFLAKIEEELK